MALNNMSNTPEAVEEHIRKQIEGSGIGQAMAKAVLAAQKPMTITDLAKKHNLEPESAKAFLREWVEQQKPVAWIRYRSDGLYEGPIMDHSKDMGEVRRQAGVWTPLIARPTDLGD